MFGQSNERKELNRIYYPLDTKKKEVCYVLDFVKLLQAEGFYY